MYWVVRLALLVRHRGQQPPRRLRAVGKVRPHHPHLPGPCPVAKDGHRGSPSGHPASHRANCRPSPLQGVRRAPRPAPAPRPRLAAPRRATLWCPPGARLRAGSALAPRLQRGPRASPAGGAYGPGPITTGPPLARTTATTPYQPRGSAPPIRTGSGQHPARRKTTATPCL